MEGTPRATKPPSCWKLLVLFKIFSINYESYELNYVGGLITLTLGTYIVNTYTASYDIYRWWCQMWLKWIASLVDTINCSSFHKMWNIEILVTPFAQKHILSHWFNACAPFSLWKYISHSGQHSQMAFCYQPHSDITPSFYLINQLTVVESATNPTNFFVLYLHKNKVQYCSKTTSLLLVFLHLLAFYCSNCSSNLQ